MLIRTLAAGSLLVGSALIAAPALAGPPPAAAPGAAAAETPWRIAYAARLSETARLNTVDATSTTDAWAVGTQGGTEGEAGDSVIMHWNGNGWAEQFGRPHAAELSTISAASPTDVWATGWVDYEYSQTIVMHYDGSAWKEVPAKEFDYPQGFVVEATKDRTWLAGTTGGKIGTRDGSAWKVETVDAGATYNEIDSRSASDAWVVGHLGEWDDPTPFAAHWDGSAWKKTPMPAIKGAITSVQPLPGGKAAAVGFESTDDPYKTKPRLFSWDGSQWTVQAAPDLTTGARLNSIAASEDGKTMWAGVSRYGKTTEFLKYSGGKWAKTTAVTPSKVETVDISDVAAIPGASGFWAVGNFERGHSVGSTNELILTNK